MFLVCFSFIIQKSLGTVITDHVPFLRSLLVSVLWCYLLFVNMDAVVIISLKSRVSENVSKSLLENKIEVVRKCDTFIDILKNFVIKHSVVVERLRLHIGRFSALFDDKLKFGTLIEMTKRKQILPGDTPEIHYFAHCDVTKD